MMVEEEKAVPGKLDSTNFGRQSQEREDCCSLHIGLSVPRDPHRKRNSRACLSGLPKVHWGPHPDRLIQEPLGTGSTGDHGEDLVSQARSPAAEQLQYILGEEDEAPNPTLFTEMDTLQHDGDQMEWKESARRRH